MICKLVEWDSNFFSKKIYKATLNNNFTDEEKTEIQDLNADLIYIVASEPNPSLIKNITNLGALLYDKKVTYKKSSFFDQKEFTNNLSFNSAINLSSNLEKMVYQSGKYSRFNLDRNLNYNYERLYRTWIDKSLSRELADEVLVAVDPTNNEVGFITLKKTEYAGNIGLIAVDEKYRGKKIGVDLLLMADQWYKENSVKEATIVTQLDNIPACNLYEKMGYSLDKLEYIFHLWKK